jgi:hypothetical protein
MPAQVSGPGPYSKRTDTGGQPIVNLPDPDYGEATEYRAMQKGAPLSDSASDGPKPPYPSDVPGPAPQPQVEAAGPERAPLPGLFDRGDPNIPVTAGAPIGPGANSVTGGMATPQPYSVSKELSQYAAGDGGEAVAWLAGTLAKMGY